MHTTLLALAAFPLGAFPFSIVIGRLFLGKDIRDYGDGNPGAANVFRAGGQVTGVLAVVLDVAKGAPFVYLAHSSFGLPLPSLFAIGMFAILGHVFSPFLRWRGGKAVAVSFGVILAMPQQELLLAFIVFMVLGFLFIGPDAWTVVFGAAGSLVYTIITTGGSWESLLLLCVLAIFVAKNFGELHTMPGINGRLVRWLQTVIRGAFSTL